MDRYFLLNSRRRALIALVHSAVFLAVACNALLSPGPQDSATRTGLLQVAAFCAIVALLLLFTRMSRCLRERLYFGFCATSASFATLRMAVGSTVTPVAHWGRICMLLAAATVAISIFRQHGQTSASATSVPTSTPSAVPSVPTSASSV